MAQTITIWEVPRPEPVPDPDFSELKKMAAEYLDDVEAYSEQRWDDLHMGEPDDFVHYMFEGLMKAVYGDDVFEFINERT